MRDSANALSPFGRTLVPPMKCVLREVLFFAALAMKAPAGPVKRVEVMTPSG